MGKRYLVLNNAREAVSVGRAQVGMGDGGLGNVYALGAK